MSSHLGRRFSPLFLDRVFPRQNRTSTTLFVKGRSVPPAVPRGVWYFYFILSTGLAPPALSPERPARLYKVVPHTCQFGMIIYCCLFCILVSFICSLAFLLFLSFFVILGLFNSPRLRTLGYLLNLDRGTTS